MILTVEPPINDVKGRVPYKEAVKRMQGSRPIREVKLMPFSQFATDERADTKLFKVACMVNFFYRLILS